MALVRKVLVPEDVYRVLVSCESDINDLFIRRFQCTAEVTGPRIGAGSAPEKVYEKRLLQGPQISVWRDDLTRQDVDVVVNAANEYLDHIGGLAYALVEAGGQQINRESEDWIKQNGRLSVGAIAVTSAGRLPSRRIVHVVGPRWSTGVEDKCKAQLQEAIRNVLRSVMLQTDVHSVAIPAVSSGIFGFPLDLCADIIVRTVHTVCSSEDKGRLREIRLVNHDDKTVGAMRAACEKILGQSDTLSGAMSSPAQTRQWHQETSPQMVLSGTINGLNLHLKMGQIEDEKTEVIVNSVSEDLNLRAGAISGAIYQKAGHRLQDEINRRSPQRSGNMIPTRGFDLPCRYVYHVILSHGVWGATRTLQDVTKQCLTTARDHRAPSISFPALGTGNIGLQKDKVADIMTQAVLDFARGNPCKMDVYFVIHPRDKDTFKAFQDKLITSGIISDKKMEFSERRGGSESSEMCVSITGERGEDVAEAAGWFGGLVFAPDPLLIHNNHLLLFGSKEFSSLSSAHPSVDIEEDLREGRAALKIRGPLPQRVMAAIQAERLLLDIQDEFAESLEEELLEAAVIWFYESQSKSHRYPTKANRELEKAFATCRNITLTAPPGHVIDIKSLTAKEGDQTYTIRRCCLRDSLQTGLMSDKQLPQTRLVDPNSQEFKDRSKEFSKAGLALLKMEKVQNKLLSGIFQSKKEAVEQRQQRPSSEPLYQLVPGQFCRFICDVGFHRLYVTPTDTKYMAGVYFKKNLHNLLQRFHVPEKDKVLTILQAEVVTGAAAKYSRNQPALPCVGSDALQVYESLIDGGWSAEHFAIFDRFYANPQYVFTCRYKG